MALPLSRFGVFAILAALGAAQPGLCQPPPESVRDLARTEARRHGVDVTLVLAVIGRESGFDPRARSPRGAMGLMQLMPDTARRFGVVDPWDPAENLRGGCAYLRWLIERYDGDIRLVLAAYNAGEGAVDGYGGVPPYPETRAYVAALAAPDRPASRSPLSPRPPSPHPVVAWQGKQPEHDGLFDRPSRSGGWGP